MNRERRSIAKFSHRVGDASAGGDIPDHSPTAGCIRLRRAAPVGPCDDNPAMGVAPSVTRHWVGAALALLVAPLVSLLPPFASGAAGWIMAAIVFSVPVMVGFSLHTRRSLLLAFVYVPLLAVWLPIREHSKAHWTAGRLAYGTSLAVLATVSVAAALILLGVALRSATDKKTPRLVNRL